MKRIIKLSGFVLGLLMPMCVSAQMDNLANMSAKWIRANARNAHLMVRISLITILRD